jgi:integrase
LAVRSARPRKKNSAAKNYDVEKKKIAYLARAVMSAFGTVPLSPAAVLPIREGLEASKEDWEGQERPAFAGRFAGVRNLARHSLSHAVRRIVKDKKLAKFTPHDLRRMSATLA